MQEQFCSTNNSRKSDSYTLSLGLFIWLFTKSSYKKEHQASHNQLLLDCCKQNCEHQARHNPHCCHARYYFWNSPAFFFTVPVNHQDVFSNKQIYSASKNHGFALLQKFNYIYLISLKYMQNKIFTFNIILKRYFWFVYSALDVVVFFSIKVDLGKIEDFKKSDSYNESNLPFCLKREVFSQCVLPAVTYGLEAQRFLRKTKQKKKYKWRWI